MILLKGGTWQGRRPSGGGGGKRSVQGLCPNDSIFCLTVMVLNPLQNNEFPTVFVSDVVLLSWK